MINRFVIAAAAALLVLPADGIAQRAGSQRAGAPRADSTRRAALEQRARTRTGEMLQQRLGLSPEQMQRLAPVRERVEQQRRALIEQERQARTILRAELASGDSADQARVAQQLDRLIAVQRDRVALLQQEQRSLAEFLTPVQRARYQGLREAVGRRMRGGQAMRPGKGGRPGMQGRPGAARRPQGGTAPDARRTPLD